MRLISKYQIGLPITASLQNRLNEIEKQVGQGEFKCLGEYLCLGFTVSHDIVLVSETGRVYELPYTKGADDFHEVQHNLT
jgi:hypothetical protein